MAIGFPCRLTASVSVGRPGVVNIMREAKMSGQNLNRADLIVQGVLKKHFAQTGPLALEICFSFEQAYDGIDGDSASLAEYFAILSSIAKIPLKQSIAITGSMNLHGEVQPIGGVNQKIEGFFDACAASDCLTGEQGVVIPWQNKTSLMLRPDIVAAVRKKKFHIWAIRTLEEGIEIFSGMKAGALGEGGMYPENTFYGLVEKEIERYRNLAKTAFSRDGDK